MELKSLIFLMLLLVSGRCDDEDTHDYHTTPEEIDQEVGINILVEVSFLNFVFESQTKSHIWSHYSIGAFDV